MMYKLIQILKGGAGSGNFGHAGRLGKVGGSTNYAKPSELDFVSGYNAIIAERGMNFPLFTDDLNYFKQIKPGVKADGKRKGNFGLCHLNAMENCKDDESMQVAVGVVLDSDAIQAIKDFDANKYWSYGTPQQPLVHVWNVDNQGRVVDNSLGSSYGKGGAYIGVIIPQKQLTELTEGMTNSDPLLDYAHDLYAHLTPNVSSDELTARWNMWKQTK